ncbi:restriction endonuclease subunit S, partial [Staphylococcus delphini]|uniref:restriction endonuclease subunit S n=1 Tax=Staphylococcus delphini TaxID=53344 RepID=UPI001CCD1AFF
PELRFPEFEGEWKLNNVGDLFEFKNGLNKEKEFFGYGSSIVNFKDVFNNRGINTKELTGKVYVNDKELKNYSVKNGDVLFTRTSEVIDEIGYPSVILDNPENTVFSGFVLRARPKIGIELVDNLFKRYVFFTTSFRKEMITKSSMTTRALTSGTAINKMEIKYPASKNEQQKIGDFFSKIDHQIALEEQKLALLEQQKKGYMQKIFSQELRFKDDNGNDYPEWEEKRFLDLFKVIPSKDKQINSRDVLENGRFPVVDQGKKLFLGYSNEKSKVIENFENFIIYGDHTTIIKRINEPFIIGGDGVKLLTGIDEKPINYLFVLLQYFNVVPEGYKRHYSILKTRNMYVSTFAEEQCKIGNFFRGLDMLIEKQSRKVDLLKQRKQGLLQKMFI